MSDYLKKYNIPAFHAEEKPPLYYWWRWHPNYPFWYRTSWGGESPEEAKQKQKNISVFYHMKLIKEQGEKLEEIEDIPCTRTDVWDKCIADKTLQ